MKISAKSAAILVITVILAGILMLRLTGQWITESQKIPQKISEGAFEGEADPADIRGSYAFSDIEEHFGVPSDLTAQAFNFDTSESEAGEYMAKDVEAQFEGAEGLNGDIGTDAVRMFVSLYKGIPFESEEDTILPSTAIDILAANGKITENEAEALYAKSFKVEKPAPVTAVQEDSQEHEEESEDMTIKGNTTFKDLFNWGLSASQIEEVLGHPIGSEVQTVRDFCTEYGEEFSVYKRDLQTLVDAL